MNADTYPQVQYRRGGPDRRRQEDDEKPTLHKLMAAGERRLEHVARRISDRFGSEGSLSFDRAERLFLREALRLMELYHALTSEEQNPATALRNVLYQLEQLGLPDSSEAHDELRAAVAKARTILSNLRVD